MIVIAFYVVPFITSWGRLLPEGGGVLGGGGAGHYGVLFCFLFRFLSCFSCASFYYWCCYIPFEKCLLRVPFYIFAVCILFLPLFLGISLWLFVLVQALLVSI